MTTSPNRSRQTREITTLTRADRGLLRAAAVEMTVVGLKFPPMSPERIALTEYVFKLNELANRGDDY